MLTSQETWQNQLPLNKKGFIMKFKSLLAVALSSLALVQVACAETNAPAPAKTKAVSQYQEGKNYVTLDYVKGINKPQVIEFFSYTCGHCYTMESFLHKWLETKPENIEFVQVPVYMDRVGHLTQGYYTAEVLGVLDKVHMRIFNKWHKEKKVIRRKEDLIPIFTEAGVSKEEFEKAYNSFAVANKVQHAKKLVEDFKVTSFPRLIVNQKYEVKDYRNLINLLNELPIEKLNK